MKKPIALFIILSLLLVMGGCSQGKSAEIQRYQAEFLTLFDTYTQIIGYSDDEDLFSAQADYIYENLEIYHQLSDIYNDYEGINNLKTINDNAGIKAVKVDQKVIDMLKFGKEIYRISEGKVNIAFGSVLKIWHEYREEGIANPDAARIPEKSLLAEASKHTDIDKVVIDEENQTVYLADPEMSLDVGAIAKGYATEQVGQMVEKKWDGISILMSVGGNVKAIGTKTTSEGTGPWNVGVTDPDNENEMLLTLNVSDNSMVTSGDYQRYYMVDGVRYHHIIDPDTLYPSTHCRAVTILTPDSGLADGLSTAAFILPVDDAISLLKDQGVEAVFVMNDGTLKYTDGFKEYIKD